MKTMYGSFKSDGFILSTVDHLLNLTRANSLFWMMYGTACCAIEMMQAGGPRTDIDRFGAAPRASPRQCDLIMVAGTVTLKMASRLRKLYDQMPEPRYVISMGSCSNTGGLFQAGYSVLNGVDRIIPVDVYLPGCPPRPEALLSAIVELQEKIKKEKFLRKK